MSWMTFKFIFLFWVCASWWSDAQGSIVTLSCLVWWFREVVERGGGKREDVRPCGWKEMDRTSHRKSYTPHWIKLTYINRNNRTWKLSHTGLLSIIRLPTHTCIWSLIHSFTHSPNVSHTHSHSLQKLLITLNPIQSFTSISHSVSHSLPTTLHSLTHSQAHITHSSNHTHNIHNHSSRSSIHSPHIPTVPLTHSFAYHSLPHHCDS